MVEQLRLNKIDENTFFGEASALIEPMNHLLYQVVFSLVFPILRLAQISN